MKLDECPFCGHEPELSTIGACLDIDCCVNMSIQKHDYLSPEDYKTWNNKTGRYSDEAEQILINAIAKKWNERA